VTIKTIAIISPGDMGSGIGKVLVQEGYQVLTCLDGRSPLTKELALKAGFQDTPNLAALLSQADCLFSIVPPESALSVAQDVAGLIKSANPGLLYVDCNAIAPQTTLKVAEIIGGAGARYVDGGIIGSPPERRGLTRVYLSGPDASELLELHGQNIDFRALGNEIGTASALKMCYASQTKGTTALWLHTLVTAQSLGVLDLLRNEWTSSHPALWGRMEDNIPTVPHRAGRWISEMKEIALTMEGIGLTPDAFEGAAAIYELVDAVFHQKGYSEGPSIMEVLTMIEDHLHHRNE
jgi:3-hydroxyisobutyrate dehydrogenase-like beta-hydroxyacid dehydrogenase